MTEYIFWCILIAGSGNTIKLSIHTERRRHPINKYIGTYRVFAPIDKTTGKSTTNEFDTYLKASKYKIECYRQNDDQLALYFPSGLNSTKIILPEFKNNNIAYTLHIDGEYEKVYLIFEKDLDKVHNILKFQTKGRNVKPSSIRTARRQK